MDRRIVRMWAGPAVAVAALFVVASPLVAESVYAAPSYVIAGATLTASNTVVLPGGSITINGSDFGANENVTIDLSGEQLATTTTDAAGDFSATVTIPSDTSLGEHVLTATNATGGVISIDIDVVSTTTAPTGTLPLTGANLELPVGLSAGAIAVGGLLVLGARRRRSAWTK